MAGDFNVRRPIIWSILYLIHCFTEVASGCQDGSITANPEDCSTYIQCDHGQSLIRPCPSGLFFNSQISTCDWPQNTNCGDVTVSTTKPPTTAVPSVTPITSSSRPPMTTTTMKPFTSTSTKTTTQNSQTSTQRTTTITTTTTATSSTSTPNPSPPGGPILFAPYFDVNIEGPKMTDIYSKTSQKNFMLAFALGSSEGCVPKWGGQVPLDSPNVLGPMRELQAKGGQFVVATGGAMGPYFEQLCTSVDTLASAYKKVLDTTQLSQLDIDIESTVNADMVNQALALVQKERPQTIVSFTLMIQAEDYGLTPALGVDFLKSAKKNGVRVDFVNAMTMEFGGPSPDYGDSVIGAANSVLTQMKQIWPEKNDVQLKKMLGVTPMIGRNFNGKIFQLEHAQKLVNWANTNHIGRLHFWSAGRDNGGCAGGAISPSCSSISQNEYQFIKIFQGFKG